MPALEATIDAQLHVGAVSTSVEVSGGAPIIDPSRVSTGRTIGHEETDNLPLTSRNPYNFILFQPGVSGHPESRSWASRGFSIPTGFRIA